MKPQPRLFSSSIATLIACLAAALPVVALADAPPSIPVQGILSDAEGAPINGTRSVTFKLYDVDVSGTPFFTETQSLLIEDGVFVAYLGDVSTLDLDLFVAHPTVFLGVTVEGDSEMLPRVSVASVPFAAYAEHAGNARTLDGMRGDAFATAEHTHAWSQLTDVPAGLSDGDNDTTYAAGAGLSLSSNTFSVDTSAVQSRVSGSCTPGDYMISVNADGSVECGTPVDTSATYSAGSGLSLSGTTFSVDTAAVQSRVSGTCATGDYMIAVNADGSVECETPSASAYTAGTGMSLSGSTFSVDSSVVRMQSAQVSLGASCAADGPIALLKSRTDGDSNGSCETGSRAFYIYEDFYVGARNGTSAPISPALFFDLETAKMTVTGELWANAVVTGPVIGSSVEVASVDAYSSVDTSELRTDSIAVGTVLTTDTTEASETNLNIGASTAVFIDNAITSVFTVQMSSEGRIVHVINVRSGPVTFMDMQCTPGSTCTFGASPIDLPHGSISLQPSESMSLIFHVDRWYVISAPSIVG